MCSLKHASQAVLSKRPGSGTNGRAVKKEEVLSQEKCLLWFKQYAEDESKEEVCPEGMERFCRDLGVEPEDVSIASPLNLEMRMCDSTQHSVISSTNYYFCKPLCYPLHMHVLHTVFSLPV